ncbi:MAG: DUF2493 domain-containing protein [Clostridia bacterium]|nr:DUF2493 domain-containing protein [Clostridia bacterium]
MFKKELPTKRVVIAGSRNYTNYEEAKEYIDFCLSDIKKKNNIVIISGKARDADAIGEQYAKENGFNIEKYPADWVKYGRSAGPIRNRQMAQICDFVICFWDEKSRGTKTMIELARKYNKPIKIKII